MTYQPFKTVAVAPAATLATPATLSAATSRTVATVAGVAVPRPPLITAEPINADDRNREATRAGLTDRWCACGQMASLAWPAGGSRQMWRCVECTPARGRA